MNVPTIKLFFYELLNKWACFLSPRESWKRTNNSSSPVGSISFVSAGRLHRWRGGPQALGRTSEVWWQALWGEGEMGSDQLSYRCLGSILKGYTQHLRQPHGAIEQQSWQWPALAADWCGVWGKTFCPKKTETPQLSLRFLMPAAGIMGLKIWRQLQLHLPSQRVTSSTQHLSITPVTSSDLHLSRCSWPLTSKDSLSGFTRWALSGCTTQVGATSACMWLQHQTHSGRVVTQT